MKKAPQPVSVSSFRGVRTKATKWLRRFLPAEVVGTLIALVCTYVTMQFTDNRVTIAYAASIAETASFYLTIITTDILLARKKLKAENRTLTWKGALSLLKNMLIDFGLAELADSFVIRPFFMYIFPLWLGNYVWGTIAGKIASDIVFYVPVIIAAEIRGKRGE